jgi:hypothetical protein
MPPDVHQSVADKLGATLWPIVLAVLFAAAVRTGVFLYMRHRGFRKPVAELGGFVAFAITVLLMFGGDFATRFAGHP